MYNLFNKLLSDEMCQIVSKHMLRSNFSCFCILVAAIQVFTTPTQASVLWNCDCFARSSCFLWLHKRFLQTQSSSQIQLPRCRRCNNWKCIGLPLGWLMRLFWGKFVSFAGRKITQRCMLGACLGL